MPLILAIEPDKRQAAQLSAVVRNRVGAELILVETTERALDAIGDRMPDLVLVPALLSPQDDAALAGALRVIAEAARVQMLTIPVLGAARRTPSSGGMLSALRRGKPRAVQSNGCDPVVFAEQIASYLERAAQERASTTADVMPDEAPSQIEETAPAEIVEAVAAEEAAPVALSLEIVEAEGETIGAAVTQSPTEAVEDERVVLMEPMNPEPVHAQVQTPVPVPAQFQAPIDGEELSLAAGADESVSIALEEAVRALFADQSPAEEPAAATPVLLSAPEPNDWVAVEDLLAALEVIPLSAIEAFEEDERTPEIEFREDAAERPERVIEDPDGDDIDLTPDRKDDDVHAPPAAARSEREWVALIESLRHDVERLRVERSEKPRQPPAARTPKSGRKAKPLQDEWGFFDPEQCGFAALLAKLDEVTEAEESRV